MMGVSWPQDFRGVDKQAKSLRSTDHDLVSGREMGVGELKGRHMARALLGYVGNSNEQVLRLEVARLRNKVSELEAQLAEARVPADGELDLDDLELHRMAEVAEPALA